MHDERLDGALAAQVAALTAKVELQQRQIEHLEHLEPQIAQLTVTVQLLEEQIGGARRGSVDRRRRSSAVETLSRELQRLTSELEEEKENARQGAELSVVVMLVLSYADLLSDIYVAVLLLGTEQAVYGVASFGFLGVSLVLQVFVVKFMGKKAWRSKDVLLTVLCLGPLLQAYRDAFGEPERPPGALPARTLLGALKLVEVAFETLPEIVIQLALFIVSPAAWSSVALLVSLYVSIAAAAMLMVEAEAGANSVRSTRRVYMEYFGYLPLQGARQRLLLCTMVVFAGAYLVLAAGTIAVATTLLPMWVVLAVLGADCGLHHLTRAVQGEWWIFGDDVRGGAWWFVDGLATQTSGLSGTRARFRPCATPTGRVRQPPLGSSCAPSSRAQPSLPSRSCHRPPTTPNRLHCLSPMQQWAASRRELLRRRLAGWRG
jgi:hypothetical protein